MEIIFDTSGGVRKWLFKQEYIYPSNYDCCVGWKDTNMCAALGFEKQGEDCLVDIVVKKKQWWSRKNLTFVCDVCYTNLKCKRIKAITSKKNYKIHSVLDRLGFHRNKEIIDGVEFVVFKLPIEELDTKKWYLGGLKNG